LTHGVPNTPQVKPTEDNCEAFFTQHVSNVTLCRCQIYSVVDQTSLLIMNQKEVLDALTKKENISFSQL
jgi:hypothetical protein